MFAQFTWGGSRCGNVWVYDGRREKPGRVLAEAEWYVVDNELQFEYVGGDVGELDAAWHLVTSHKGFMELLKGYVVASATIGMDITVTVMNQGNVGTIYFALNYETGELESEYEVYLRLPREWEVLQRMMSLVSDFVHEYTYREEIDELLPDL